MGSFYRNIYEILNRPVDNEWSDYYLNVLNTENWQIGYYIYSIINSLKVGKNVVVSGLLRKALHFIFRF